MEGTVNRKEKFLASDVESDIQGQGLKRQKVQGIKVFNVAEKPLQAKQISRVLSKGGCHIIKGSSPDIPDRYEFQYVGDREVYDMVFSSVVGHFKKTGFVREGFEVGDHYEPLKIFRIEMVTFVPAKKLGIYNMLLELASKNAWLYLWMDADREGNKLGFDIKDACKIRSKWVSSAEHPIPCYTEEELGKLMNSGLHHANKSFANAVTVRQEIDLKAGTCFSNIQSTTLKIPFNILFDSPLGFGLCGFPILSQIVDRHREVMLNRSKKVYYITGTYGRYSFKWKKDGVTSETLASRVLNNCNLFHREAVVISSDAVPREKAPPHPLTMYRMLKLASIRYGMTVSRASEAAQYLHQSDIISYPRSDSNRFAKGMDFNNILRILKDDRKYGKHAKFLADKNKWRVPVGGGHLGAHPPIHPIGVYGGSTNSDRYKIYSIVVEQFLACVSEDVTYDEWTVVIQNRFHDLFTAIVRKIKQPGYSTVYNNLENCVPRDTPEYDKGKTIYPVWSLNPRDKVSPMSLVQVICFMEKCGIGTSATIAKHMKKLIKNHYVVEEGNRLIPTHLGEALISGHLKVENELVDVTMRRSFEKDLDDLSTDDELMSSVQEKWLKILETNFEKITTGISDFTAGFEYFYGQSRFVMKCDCGKADMGLGQLPSKQFIVTCSRYKKVERSKKAPPNICVVKGYFLPEDAREVIVTGDKCSRCLPKVVFLIKVTLNNGEVKLHCAGCRRRSPCGNLANVKVNDGKCRKCGDTFPEGWHRVCHRSTN